jgi:hypothetical protein
MGENKRHKNLTIADGIHVPYAWTYADGNARLAASGFTTADLGKFARQLDNNSIWMLIAITPTWQSVNSQGESFVSVTENDLNPDHLAHKTTSDPDKIILTVLDPGGNEQLEFSPGPDLMDSKVDGQIDNLVEKELLSPLDIFVVEDSQDSYKKKKVNHSAVGGKWAGKNITHDDTPFYITHDAVAHYVDTTNGNVDVYLPTGDDHNNCIIMITKIDDSTNVVNIYPQNGDSITDVASIVLDHDDSGITLHRNTDGEWRVAGGDQRASKIDNTNRITNSLTTGVLDGGVLSINGDPTKFDITDVYALFVNNTTSAFSPTRKLVHVTGLTAIPATNLVGYVTYIAIDSNGNVIQSASEFSYADSRDYAILGILTHASHTAIDSVVQQTEVAYSAPASLRDFVKAFGIFNVKGNTYNANGANLKINKSSGETFFLGANYAVSRKVPSIKVNDPVTALSFKYLYRDGANGWNYSSTLTDIDTGNWDDGTGNLNDVETGKWTIQYVFYYPITGTTTIQYGQLEFDDLPTAKTHVNDAFEISPILEDGAHTFRGYIIVQKGATALNNIAQCQFYDAGRFGLATALSGSVSGEVNTGLNIGTSGVGVFAQKSGVQLQFKNLISANNKITIVDTPLSHGITFTLVEGNILHSNIGEVGTNTHAQIDSAISDSVSHIANTFNPHGTTKAQVGLSTVTNDAQLKRAAADFFSFTEKLTPVGDDILLIEDSASADAKKKLLIKNISHSLLADIGTNAHTVIDSHLANTSNPHGTTASQIGLGNVTNDAQLKRLAGDFNSFTAKSPVVGADIVLIEDSAASFAKKKVTVTDLLASHVFGTQYQAAASEGLSTTTSSTYVNKLTFTTSNLPAGTYHIQFYREMSNSVTNQNYATQITVDGSTVAEEISRMSNAGEFRGRAGHYEAVFASSGTHVINLDFRTDGGTLSIKRARIVIWRMI